MNKQQLEAKVLKIVHEVASGKDAEDSLVELKAQWPVDYAKAARQLGGHANASHAQPILWIIGIDEKSGVCGADKAELAKWWPGLERCFDLMAPELTCCLNIPTDSGTVVALLFETDRAPYVVNGDDGKREVPWRSANDTRSARRSELLTLLSSLNAVPSFEAISGAMAAEINIGAKAEEAARWELHLQLFAYQDIGVQAVIPFHRCECLFEAPQRYPRTFFKSVRLSPPSTRRLFYAGTQPTHAYREEPETTSFTIAGNDSEVVISGPGALDFRAYAVGPAPQPPLADLEIMVILKLALAPGDASTSLKVILRFSGRDKGPLIWELAGPDD